jgi:5-methylcytosine-specific restriction endonuclease McrA
VTRYRDIYPNRDPRAGADGEKWRRLRDRVIRREPICRQCGRRASVECHHIEPVVRRPDLALTWTNLLPCCRECHRRLDRGVVKPKREPPPRPEGDYAC